MRPYFESPVSFSTFTIRAIIGAPFSTRFAARSKCCLRFMGYIETITAPPIAKIALVMI